MHPKQPGMVLKFKAKPGKGDELFAICNELHFNNDPDGPVDWLLARSDEDPDVMWAFELYLDDESFERHYSNPAMDAGHQRVLDLIADGSDDWGVRESIHVVYSS